MKMTIKISRHVLYRINSFVNKDRSEDRRFIYICMYILFRYIVFRTNKIFFLLFFFFVTKLNEESWTNRKLRASYKAARVVLCRRLIVNMRVG